MVSTRFLPSLPFAVQVGAIRFPVFTSVELFSDVWVNCFTKNGTDNTGNIKHKV